MRPHRYDAKGRRLDGMAGSIGLQLPEALSIAAWAEIGQELGRVERAVRWWVGDWTNFGARKYGEVYSQHLDATGLGYRSVADCSWVAGRFELSRRRENLDWSHHREVAALQQVEQDRLLDEAAKKGWSKQDLRRAVRRFKAALSAPPMPVGSYDVILCDPPWYYRNAISGHGAADDHYQTMSMADLKALPVQALAAPDSTLFLWTTNPSLADALELAESWGFTYRTNLVWVKRTTRPGIGFYVRGDHELLFICTRGSHAPDTVGRPIVSSVLEAPAREHSRKPEEIYALIETLYPEARRLELFARGSTRPAWQTWGDEAA